METYDECVKSMWQWKFVLHKNIDLNQDMWCLQCCRIVFAREERVWRQNKRSQIWSSLWFTSPIGQYQKTQVVIVIFQNNRQIVDLGVVSLHGLSLYWVVLLEISLYVILILIKIYAGKIVFLYYHYMVSLYGLTLVRIMRPVASHVVHIIRPQWKYGQLGFRFLLEKKLQSFSNSKIIKNYYQLAICQVDINCFYSK